MKKLLLIFAMALMTAGMTAQGRPPQHDRSNHHHDMPPKRHIVCATPEQMGMVMNVLDKQSFDDKKLEVAKLCVTLGHFCVEDLARMAVVFSFDENRLQFLTYAYDYCQDPQNYYLLRESFSFRSNFDTMMETLLPGYRR